MVYYPVRHRIMALWKIFFTRKNAPPLVPWVLRWGTGGTARTRGRLQVKRCYRKGECPGGGGEASWSVRVL